MAKMLKFLSLGDEYTSMLYSSLQLYVSLKFFKIKNQKKTAITLYFQSHEPPLQMLPPKQDHIHCHVTKEQRKENTDVRNAFPGKTHYGSNRQHVCFEKGRNKRSAFNNHQLLGCQAQNQALSGSGSITQEPVGWQGKDPQNPHQCPVRSAENNMNDGLWSYA